MGYECIADDEPWSRWDEEMSLTSRLDEELLLRLEHGRCALRKCRSAGIIEHRSARLEDRCRLLSKKEMSGRPLAEVPYKAADLRPDTFEKTTDAYMYDVIFTYFSQDKDFRSRWNVVGFMAGVPDKTQKQACRQCGRAYESLKEDVCQHCKQKREMGRAPIRVVMDMPSMTETLPRSYPPVVPGKNKPKMIPGLPIGYSVPLEAYTVEDGRILLERQKQFNNDQIDPRFKWLQDIMDEYDAKVAGDRQKDEPKVSNATNFLWSQLTGMLSSASLRESADGR
ncbi:unnamed protein product [Cladocopium goreaui]|uniref:Uncharacterized protein n=1 Tax=Cladocopium goreaui TaxID=2562237 RepID=A0A9P1CF27_9DINO|nr:unnamed protein product [Cladocopium goreaui]